MAVAPSHLDDAPVVAGDLYARHAPALHAFCLARLRNRHDAEEAVQVTYLRALRALQTGIRPYNERAWLLTIARNVCVSQATRAHRRREIALEPAVLADEATTPPVELGTDPQLLAALEALPEGQRRAFVLRAVDGLTYDEIATELGVSQAAVETWIFRARRKLAAAVGEHRRRLSADVASLLSGVKALVGGGVALKATAAAVVAVATTTVVVAAPRTTQRTPDPIAPAIADDSSSVPSADTPAVESPRRVRRSIAPTARTPQHPRAETPARQQPPPAPKREDVDAPGPPTSTPSPTPRDKPVPSAVQEIVETAAPVTEVVETIETLVPPVLETPLLPEPALPVVPPLELPAVLP